MLFARDTSPEARRQLLAHLRACTPAQRGRMIADAITAARTLARAGVKRHSAEDSAAARHAAFLRRWLGPDWSGIAFAAWQRRHAEPPSRDDRAR